MEIKLILKHISVVNNSFMFLRRLGGLSSRDESPFYVLI